MHSYSELLQEFGANSFGDDVFGGYLMLPLRSSEDTHIKSLFWNDQAVRFLRTRVETVGRKQTNCHIFNC